MHASCVNLARSNPSEYAPSDGDLDSIAHMESLYQNNNTDFPSASIFFRSPLGKAVSDDNLTYDSGGSCAEVVVFVAVVVLDWEVDDSDFILVCAVLVLVFFSSLIIFIVFIEWLLIVFWLCRWWFWTKLLLSIIARAFVLAMDVLIDLREEEEEEDDVWLPWCCRRSWTLLSALFKVNIFWIVCTRWRMKMPQWLKIIISRWDLVSYNQQQKCSFDPSPLVLIFCTCESTGIIFMHTAHGSH